jgi:beta-lactamase class A
MTKMFLALLLLSAWALAADKTASDKLAAGKLQQQLSAMAARFPGKVALYARDVRTGRTVALDADRPVATASVIKLPILVEAYAQARAGKLSLDDKLSLDRSNQVAGSGVLNLLRPGLQLTLYDTVVLMMTLSDNTATNMVMDAVGISAVNARMSGMGLKNTYVYKKVSQPPVGPMPPDYKQFGLGKTTAREMGQLLESIQGCAEGAMPPTAAPALWNGIGDPRLCREMIGIMRAQQYRNMIPHYLEAVDTSETPSAIADKIGMLDDVRNDVALVYTNAGPVVISAFTYRNRDQRWTADNQAELLIARMAKKIVDAWSPAGLAVGAQP